MENTIQIPREEYDKLRMQANIDVELMKQFIESLEDIKEGRVRKVK